jgi:hypothetical protein
MLVYITTKFGGILDIPSAHKRKQGIRQRLIIALKTNKTNQNKDLKLSRVIPSPRHNKESRKSTHRIVPSQTSSNLRFTTAFSAARPEFPVHRPSRDAS